nr:hypothetical protein [Pandoravirus massiliensis]
MASAWDFAVGRHVSILIVVLGADEGESTLSPSTHARSRLACRRMTCIGKSLCIWRHQRAHPLFFLVGLSFFFDRAHDVVRQRPLSPGGAWDFCATGWRWIDRLRQPNQRATCACTRCKNVPFF